MLSVIFVEAEQSFFYSTLWGYRGGSPTAVQA